MQILICADESSIGEKALQYGVALARAARAEVVLLGLPTRAAAEPDARALLSRAQEMLEWRTEEHVRFGKPAHVILAEVEARPYDLVVMGSRGRRGWQRVAFGSVAARLARYSPIPVLIVKGERPVIRTVLACTSGDVRGERVGRWGGQVARWFNATSTILHVMSQMPIAPNANLDELEDTAEEAIAHRTREGRHLQRELELMRAQGAAAHMEPRIRHGLVLDEIVAEMREGDYDMLVIGGHQTPDFGGSRSRLRDYLLEDVADQIIMAVDRPVLVVKGK